MDGPGDIRCHEIVELVTEYLEDGLSEPDRTRFELHVMACRGCAVYLDQMRTTAETVGEVDVVEPEGEQLDELLMAFRDWHSRTTEEP